MKDLRHSRLPAFVRPDRDPGEALSAVHVGAIGAGSIGLEMDRQCAQLGVRAVDAIDPKSFKEESVYTHNIGRDQIGKGKAEYAEHAVRSVNPHTRVRAFTDRVEDVPPEVVADWDIALLATDNLHAEQAAGEICMNYGVPLIQASVDGDTLVAQIRFFANRDGDGPCPTCQYSRREWHMLNRSVRFSCDGSGTNLNEEPTRSIASLCTLAACLAVTTMVKHVVGLGRDLSDRILEYTGYTNEIRVSPLRRNPACPCPHIRYTRKDVDGDVHLLPVRELARLAGANDDDIPATLFGVEGQVLATRCQCRACGQVQELNRFIRPVDLGEVVCPDCGGGTHVFTDPFMSGRKLRELGADRLAGRCHGNPAVIVIRPDGRGVLLRDG